MLTLGTGTLLPLPEVALVPAAPRVARLTAGLLHLAALPMPQLFVILCFHASQPCTYPAKQAPNPSNVLGVFGLSIRTTERDLDEEFSRFGRVEKVVIVYDQRSDRSRGFGFISMSAVDEATRCIKELNGVELNGRRIRVDYSVTDRPHAPTPGEYMGHRRRRGRDTYSGFGGDRPDDVRDSYRDSYRDRRDREPYRRDDKDRDHYGRDSRDWRDRRSPPPRSRYSPDYRRRRSYSRSPPRGSSPTRARDYDAPSSSALPPANGEPRW
ncbi:uncharacterized protein C8Q71DRAFT_11906 [Rhodofomes roseus]|uniref:RRM domain-containing protein n=1 Tax=Rhodofomes roseus TaxID=34475 RepID=A0ABQ8KWR1_9APHY|nr:uncharacterized protein C8Q71DRAFT_11906 [Rhodofomes roseus]KAH9843734.1 hypothetical protein C8Q71DRAFT_11906 [Rhodofomes roseus]